MLSPCILVQSLVYVVYWSFWFIYVCQGWNHYGTKWLATFLRWHGVHNSVYLQNILTLLWALLTLQLHIAARWTFKSELEKYGAWCPGSIHMCCLRFRAVWRRSSQIKRCNFGCEISLHCPRLNSRVFHLMQKVPYFDYSSLLYFLLFFLGRLKVNWGEVSWVCCTIFSQGSLLFCSKGRCSSWVVKNSPSCTGGIYNTIWTFN